MSTRDKAMQLVGIDRTIAQAHEMGVTKERERIIKLLEEAKIWLEDWYVDELINQIKGGTNERQTRPN